MRFDEQTLPIKEMEYVETDPNLKVTGTISKPEFTDEENYNNNVEDYLQLVQTTDDNDDQINGQNPQSNKELNHNMIELNHQSGEDDFEDRFDLINMHQL